MLPSPKKSPGPSVAMIASLPLALSAVIFTPPSCIYMMVPAAEPCEKITSSILNSLTLLARPAESRKAWALNAPLLPGVPLYFLLLGFIYFLARFRLGGFVGLCLGLFRDHHTLFRCHLFSSPLLLFDVCFPPDLFFNHSANNLQRYLLEVRFYFGHWISPDQPNVAGCNSYGSYLLAVS